MKTFDKMIAVKLREEIDSALKELGKKYDITFRAGSCSFSETEIKYKLEVKTNDTESLEKKRVDEWNKYYQLFGFHKEDLGKTFRLHRNLEEYRIVGFDLKRSKFDLKTVRVSDGKSFLHVSSEVKKIIHPEKIQPIREGVTV